MLTASRLPDLGLKDGTIRARDVVHNGRWYNGVGQRIGWGDLSAEDIKRIQSKLRPEELFVVLSERSAWNLPNEDKPGIDYLVEKASWVITPTVIYFRDYKNEAGEIQGVHYQPLLSASFLKLLEGA